MKRFKAVMFDLDGTLVNSLHDIADAMNYALEQHDCPIHSYDKYNYFVGNGLRKLVERTVPSEISPEKRIEILETMMERYRAHLTDKTNMYPGIVELLDELTKRGFRMTICSNKADELTKRIAERLFEKWPFEHVHGSIQGIPHKPDPTIPQMIAREMNLSTDEILYVGDSNVDMQTALNAGMYGVGVTWGFRTEEELREAGAKRIIKHPIELLND